MLFMTGDRDKQRGKVVERLIADLSSMFFMKDFVFRNPSYVTSGQEREVTDLMFVLNQDCMIVSVKGTDGRDKTAARLPLWARKKVWEASKNAKTALQRVAKLEIKATNLWDERRTFAAGTLHPICGLALVECSQEKFAPIIFAVKQPASSAPPIHFLSANDFLNVVTLLGSIWDVFRYFKLRQNVSHAFDGINQERPLLCYYTLRSHQDFSGFLNEDKEHLRQLHQLFLLDTLSKYRERDRLSSWVNSVIHQLHNRSENLDSYVPPELKHMVEAGNARTAYLGMAAMLNSLPMSNKAWIGQQIEDGIQRAKATGQSGCFFYKQLRKHVVFVFAVFTEFNRTEKLRALNSFLPAAQYSTGLGEALGIGIDANDENMGFELIWRRGPIDNSGPVRALAAQLFSSPIETLCPTPFGEPRAYSPKEQDSTL
jgi:hypothetical protein